MPSYDDRFLLTIQGLSQEMRVVRFSGTEGISELFHLELTFASEDAAIEPDDALGKPAVLTMLLGDGQDRYVSGIISRFEQGDSGKKLTAYHITVVPKVWRLQHRHDLRIFQELSAPDIIKKVLQGAGLASGDDFKVSLLGTYKSREYCVQYRESDWAFVCRLMEEEGIAWFFEHTDAGHVLVLGDRAAAFSAIAGKESVPFKPSLGAMIEAEHISTFRFAGEVKPGKISLRDFDFVKPTLLPEGMANASGANADTDLEIYDYPGIYEITADGFADGAGLAQIRLEERRSHRLVGEGESGCARLTPGYTFTLAEHPRDALNRSYLITRMEYHGVEPAMGEGGEGAEGRYGNRFTCIPATVPFHPPMITPRPVVRGVQTAIVVGPSGEEIYCDKHGRVKVQFHWDRLGKKDDKSSCWIRVSQMWAGEAWGGMHIPRINQEVVVDFLEGDPDRPLIVGRVYHGTNVAPYGLPDNKTRSTIKSNSTPGGGGSNELRFEDKTGSEEVYLHAQKDLTIAVENDKNQTVGHDETLHVSHDRTATVDHDETYEVGNDRKRTVKHDETVDIQNNRTVTVGADHTETISGNHSLTISKTSTIAVTKDTAVSLDAKLGLSVTAKTTVDLKADLATTIGGSATEDVKLDKHVKAGNTVVIECGDSKITIDKSGNVKVEGKNLKVAIDGPITVDAQKLEVTSSGEVKVSASGKVEVKGSGPMNIEASGMVKLKGANVGINLIVIVETFPVGPLGCNCSVVIDPTTKEAVVIDPGGDLPVIRAAVERAGAKVVSIVHTHTHVDHVGATAGLQEWSGAPARIHEMDRPLYEMLPVQAALVGIPVPAAAELDGDLVDGGTVEAGGGALGVLHTPGHTPGSVSFLLETKAGAVAFTGDTLFRRGIGRSDLWGGDSGALLLSIRRKLLTLDEGTRVVPGHGPPTTIGEEKQKNPFLRGR